jgi:hypothetical protein
MKEGMMERLKRFGGLVASGVVSAMVILLGVAQAEEGTVKATATWEGQGYAFPVGEDQAYMVSVYAGVMFVDGGKGSLDAASIICPGTVESDFTKGTMRGEGRCIITDQEGDRVFARFTCSGDVTESCQGPFTFVGGTGRFAGITGGGEMISRIQARQLTMYAGAENVQQLGAGVAVWPALRYKIPAKSK